ncbi:hypothetical protein [Glutamicibacter nicotianae]|uniref:hypothetical protein n=1 Tax=Glutamicibacter nicotianae TaxID=37929 RepID=UPI00167F98F1|nr:hypothetical protein [Glutamicibacter nicotianae]
MLPVRGFGVQRPHGGNVVELGEGQGGADLAAFGVEAPGAFHTVDQIGDGVLVPCGQQRLDVAVNGSRFVLDIQVGAELSPQL